MRHAVGGRGDQAEPHAHVGHTGTAQEQGVRGPAERREDAERNQRVHGRRRMPQTAQRTTVEGPGAGRRDRSGEDETQPLPVVELQGRNHRQHEHGDRQHGGDEQALPLASRLLAGRLIGLGGPFLLTRLHRLSGVTGRDNRGDQLLRCHLRRMADPGPTGGEVHLRRDTVQLAQLALDSPDTGRTRQPPTVRSVATTTGTTSAAINDRPRAPSAYPRPVRASRP